MKRVLLLLAVGALALPAFANSIPVYGSHAGGRYMSGGTTTWMAEHSTGNPVWVRLMAGVLSLKEAPWHLT